jgi:hypothetical protein
MGLIISQEMDRSKMSEIPKMQVAFYEFIVIPAFKLLHDIFGKQGKSFIDTILANKSKWEELRDNGTKYCSSRI